MKKSLILVVVLILGLAVGLYFAFNKQVTQEANSNSDYVVFQDLINNVSVSHHKDWTVQNSLGYIRFLPKSATSEFELMQVTLNAGSGVLKTHNLDKANSFIFDNRLIRYSTEENQMVDANKKPVGPVIKKTFYLWGAGDGREVLFEVTPGTDRDPIPAAQEVIKSIKFK